MKTVLAAATGRRTLGALSISMLGAAPTESSEHLIATEWRAFTQRFLTPEGRIVDTGNGGISHSEGQGWGLMFAAAFNDRAAFDRILSWTTTVLKRTGDSLHAWRFRPGATQPVDDPNNATDGDLYIAWGLLMAYERWRHAPHRMRATAIARDMLRITLRRPQGKVALLPGAVGFERQEGLILNPSYIALPAYAALHRAMPGDGWLTLMRDGSDVLRGGRFGAWGLSPDWLLVPRAAGAPFGMPEGWPKRFSFDAVRVPLMLAWAGETMHPALRGPHAFWSDQRWQQPPAWVDLETGATAEFAITPGMRAVAAFTASRIAGAAAPVRLPAVADSADYYSAALVMLTRLACAATGTRIA
ncbi:glycosyl hydrolase family 8 [Neoroseomonas rubea]|uniref:glycosyl hydrolase family 8 n=1 Tax=Neoroseomonas rubea TaxID=2748666 RepID=UPI0018DFEB21|nr:glycosyl hydrolase family 8 [Roseomonas rubea]